MIMKITEVKKKNGATVYRASVYLGVDRITGKKIRKRIKARSKKELRKIAVQEKYLFEKNGSTIQASVTVANYKELAYLWLDSYKLTVKKQTYLNTKGRLEKHILPYLGPFKLDKINPVLIQKFAHDIANKSRVHDFRTILADNKRILQYGVALQLLPFNPARDIIQPKVKVTLKEKVKHLSDGQLKQLMDYLSALPLDYKNYTYSTLIRFLLATGCRIGEAQALEWSDIDLDKGTVNINKNYQPNIQNVTTPKTKKSLRTISIDKTTLLMLRMYKARQRQEFRAVGLEDSNLIFSTPVADYIARSSLQLFLDRCLEGANLPRFTFHAFRHTHASLLLNAGITYKELQYRLGHSTITMTLDTYSHLSQEKEKEAVVLFEKATAFL